MVTIPLDRRFVEWSDAESSDPELRSLFRFDDDATDWDDLLQKRRVVILAEAGSGKTEEMKAQARRQADTGKFAFYASVQDVGRNGVASGLGPADQARLIAWHASGEPGWFFIDSVDEAKLDGIRLDQALRQIATAIHGAEGRAHVVLSARHTDWEFWRDLERFGDALPIPREQIAAPAPTPDELIVKAIRHEHRTEAPAAPMERPLVVVMEPLDRERVRLFAEAKGAKNLDDFFTQIESANLWRFARRPLDLEWMVQFWVTHNRLGSLREMLESSLTERLRETNYDRVRSDSIDPARAFEAIERIGAALVLGRARTIAIPDSGLALSGESAPISLDQVLPDWSPGDRVRLLSRPAFDPATFGRARLHNDNEGVVSAYLTARWLTRLRGIELSRRGIFDLLFANQYGLELVKPSMRGTAAWLSIWDEDVAREVMRRDPFLLLDAGDPASLPSPLRRSLLLRLADELAKGASVPLLDADGLKRFSRPDIAGTVRSIWSKHRELPEIRKLVLRLIWLGALKECADIAIEAVSQDYPDRSTMLFAGRALVAAGDDASKRRYAASVMAGLGRLRKAVIWNAVKSLFPVYIGVDDLLGILSAIDVTDADGGLGFEWGSPDLIERIQASPDLGRLLAGLLAQIGAEPGGDDQGPTHREKAFFSAIGAAAARILKLCGPHEAPAVAIDAVLRLGEHSRTTRARKIIGDAATELARTPARRRLAFWRASERLNGHRLLGGSPLDSIWEMRILGYSPALDADDTDWLLRDAPTKSTERERRLAINTAMQIWRDTGTPASLLDRIKAVAEGDPIMQAALDSWLAPRRASPEEGRHRQIKEEHDRKRDEEDSEWKRFAARIRANPEQLRELIPPTESGVDSRLFHLWQLLNASMDRNSQYAVDSVASLEPMIGAQAAAATRDGLIAHWRAWKPRLRSERKPAERNVISSIDSMGIVGVTLEAATVPSWAKQLNPELARRATAYATLEINGFPGWIADLVRDKPYEVREVLIGEIVTELDQDDAEQSFQVLGDVARADRAVARLLAPPVLDELRKRPSVNERALPRLLDIITEGIEAADLDRFRRLALDRFKVAAKLETSALYITSLFAVDPKIATEALEDRLKDLGVAEQTRLAQGILPELFGDRRTHRSRIAHDLPFEVLERLVEIAYRTIRVEEDRNRPSGVVYSPDSRDNAESARGAAFNALVETPGRSTYDTLLRLARKRDFPVSPSRLHELAHERAATDSESTQWTPAQVMTFEQTSLTTPSTARELQRVAQGRFADIQHDLLHSDFAQGGTLSALPNENAVQNWVADRLRITQRGSYSVERESHVVDEKEPDVRLRAKTSDASFPIEIKVAETWTLQQLEAALDQQLCARYLRARDARHGILLLVHQKPRRNGWRRQSDGQVLTFREVVEQLRSRAVAIAATSSDAPQPEIAVLDVSSCAKKGRTRRTTARPSGPTRARRKNATPQGNKEAASRRKSKGARARPPQNRPSKQRASLGGGGATGR